MPTWALIVLVAWACLVGLYELRDAPRAGETLCLLRNVTGIACPTCGSTRVAQALGRGRPLDAIRQNPLVAIVLVGVVGWLVLRVGFGRQPRLDLSRGARRLAWVLIVVATLVNWLYVIRQNL